MSPLLSAKKGEIKLTLLSTSRLRELPCQQDRKCVEVPCPAVSLFAAKSCLLACVQALFMACRYGPAVSWLLLSRRAKNIVCVLERGQYIYFNLHFQLGH